MSASGLAHNDTFKFDGTNYILWRNRMLCKLRALCPYIERFLDVGFSPPVDPQNLSLKDEKNLHLEAQVYNEFLRSMSFAVYVFLIVSKCKSSHEMWTKLEKNMVGPILLRSIISPRRSLHLHIMKSSKLLPPPVMKTHPL